jgi:hypothetical protein
LANATPHSSAGTSDLAAVLERDAAHDQRGQDQQQRQVEPAEQGGVPVGEGGEHARPGDDQPGLVHIPYRPDRIDHYTPAGVVLAQYRQQHAHAEIEALQEEVPGEHERDQHEPELGKGHGALLW